MPKMNNNSSRSMFGGAGGRGSRVSVASLEGLRNVMRSDPDKEILMVKDPGADVSSPDDKKTMRGLNERLCGYLGRVTELEKANKELERQIKDILAKRGAPNGRNWDEIEKPLAFLRKKIKDMATDNAKLLLQIDNTKLANEDFLNKLDGENQARRTLEHDITGLKRIIDDTQLNRAHLESQIEGVKDDLGVLKKDHKEDVSTLRLKIKDSRVVVEMDSQDSNLADTLNKIRGQYEKMAQKNLKDTEDWYHNKFENIKVEVLQNTESLESGKSELNDLNRQRQLLEIEIQAMLSTIRSLEETLKETNNRYGRELGRLNKILLGLEAELIQVREQVGLQGDAYQDLLNVKMKLEAEIENYRNLMYGVTADEDSLEFSLENALNYGTPKSDGKGAKKGAREEAPIKRGPPKEDLVKADTANKEAPAKKAPTPPTEGPTQSDQPEA